MTGAGVYLAGPSGFTQAGQRWHEEVLVPAVEAAGLEVLDPWPSGAAIIAAARPATPDAWAVVDEAIGAANTAMLRACRAVLAVLDGTDVDSGTAAEIGYAAALGRPVVGLRTDIRPGGENPGCAVNLQVEHFVVTSGGAMVTTIADAVTALLARTS